MKEVAEFQRQCWSKGLDTQILKFLQPIKIRSFDIGRGGGIPFLCCLNKCGFLTPEFCDKGIHCCHHTFSISPGATYANNAFLRCCFQQAENANQSDDYPKIELNWSQYTDTTHLPNQNITNALKGFFYNTLTKHFTECHRNCARPTCLLLAKDAKNKRKEGKLHEKKFLHFLEEEGGSDPIDHHSPDFNGELSKLEKYEYYEDYNYYEATKPKKKKKKKKKKRRN